MCGIAIKLLIDEAFHRSLNPYLPSFAAIMISAALTGFGGGVVTTFVVTVWAFTSQPHENIPDVDTGFRCAILFFEGLLLSVGFERMIRNMRASEHSEFWHRKLIATAAEGIWVVGPDCRLAYANVRIAELLGYDLQEMQGAEWKAFFFEEDLSIERIRVKARVANAIEQFDRRLRHKNGSEVWVLACVNSFTDESGDHAGYLAMMTDITERKRAEFDLRKSEARFRSLFDNVSEGVYQTTRDGRVIAANPALLRMLGVDREEDLNNPHIAHDFYPDTSNRARNLEIMEREGFLRNVEFQLRRRDGVLIDVLENARAVRDEHGQTLYYEGTLVDLTDCKRVERKMRHASQLAALNELSRGIAHDFNDALTVLSGHLKLAQAELSPSHPAFKQLEKALRGHDEAERLTKRLLSCVRLQKDMPSPGGTLPNSERADVPSQLRGQ